MIRITLQPEPEDFDARVRQPGRAAIEELIGARAGRRRKKVAECAEEIPPAKLPRYWGRCAKELHARYQGFCAYLSIFIPLPLGAGTVDHMAPKSREVGLAYEWSNYRLACSLMNSRKQAFADVLDPCEIGDGWFQLHPVTLTVHPATELDDGTKQRIQATIDRLRLNDGDCRDDRKRRLENYKSYKLPLDYLAEREAPFLAREIRRLGL